MEIVDIQNVKAPVREVSMPQAEKGKSPFYPGQPVPTELFAGRDEQIQRIMQRGVGQVAAGKPVAIFVQGDYGIGKTSIAALVQWMASRDYGLHSIYASLGGIDEAAGLGGAVLEGTIRSGALAPTRGERIRDMLSKYIGEQNLFGAVTIHLDALKKDSPALTSGLLSHLKEVHARIKDTGAKGIFLVLDEIDKLSGDAVFANALKTLVDTNALSREPLPLLLMICGVEERRRELIRGHPSLDRLFDQIVTIEAMSKVEMFEFFSKAFESVHISVEDDAMDSLLHFSAGIPKIMHLIGDAAFWVDEDNVISRQDAMRAVVLAADDVGTKFVDQQVIAALRSKDYQSILRKLGGIGLDLSFTRSEISAGLTETEKGKLDNFLQKMRTLDVIHKGEVSGEYVFNSIMVRTYFWLKFSS